MLENGELIPGIQLVPSQMFTVCMISLSQPMDPAVTQKKYYQKRYFIRNFFYCVGLYSLPFC